ncbi:hypothetical protein FAZ69_07945 [Trinickia terrae]|uniref:Uncharacterized protein n=1 Tax=Trinickia terrae TaxID=2571161 RepID=A0A4U1I9I8_9BURK|nr:hypothetical protein [Trinickia terrae]TKC90077.1 hypothetical protein FAZ69_07945 [Trinickia terrae]
MQAELRHALDTAYERMKRAEPAPEAFASNYALCLGIIIGGQACDGMSDEEAGQERAHLAMLAALYEIGERVRSDLGAQ